MSDKRFLLGKGERLTSPIQYRNRDSRGDMPYSWEDQQRTIPPQLIQMQAQAARLSEIAKPAGQYVAKIVMHPQHVSRSAYPQELVDDFQLRLLGSRPTVVRPRAGRGSDVEAGVPTTELFVAGRAENFGHLSAFLSDIEPEFKSPRRLQALTLEQIGLLQADDRVLHTLPPGEVSLELILHYQPGMDEIWRQGFLAYAQECGMELRQDLEYEESGLWFLPAVGNAQAVAQVAQFAFVRGIHQQPTLRPVKLPRFARAERKAMTVTFPENTGASAACRVAVFDGGLVGLGAYRPWVRPIVFADNFGVGRALADEQSHGTCVTSALLFGHIDGQPLEEPSCQVDHYRVLGDGIDYNNMALPEIQRAIEVVLGQRQYEFVLLCLGPEQVIRTDEVSRFAVMLDKFAQSGEKLVLIAAGNNGECTNPLDQRVMVPSEAVNAMAIGACDSYADDWQRASYSAVGPGRHPGKVKPDVLHFGGDRVGERFRFAFPDGSVWEDLGTSFAAPAVMRLATQVRSRYGADIGSQGLKALLINTASQGVHKGNTHEVGWGRTARHADDIMSCTAGEVRVIYQDTIKAGRVIRHEVPLPNRLLAGKVTVKATFCFACETDPSVPGDYTRAAFDVTFRPHEDIFNPGDEGGQYPKSKSFFKSHEFEHEHALRAGAGKWETVLNDEHTFMPTSLKRPVFDVHHIARAPGERNSPKRADDVRYALVITVTCPKDNTLYDDVLAAYGEILEVHAPLPQSVPVTLDDGATE